MLSGKKDKKGLLIATTLHGYSIKIDINNKIIKVLGYEPYKVHGDYFDTNDIIEKCIKDCLQDINSGKLKKSINRYS